MMTFEEAMDEAARNLSCDYARERIDEGYLRWPAAILEAVRAQIGEQVRGRNDTELQTLEELKTIERVYRDAGGLRDVRALRGGAPGGAGSTSEGAKACCCGVGGPCEIQNAKAGRRGAKYSPLAKGH